MAFHGRRRRFQEAFRGVLRGFMGYQRVKGVFMDDSMCIWGPPGVFRDVSAGLGGFQLGVR